MRRAFRPTSLSIPSARLPGAAARAGPMGQETKEGPAVSGGPLGYPWWSLGGSNP